MKKVLKFETHKTLPENMQYSSLVEVYVVSVFVNGVRSYYKCVEDHFTAENLFFDIANMHLGLEPVTADDIVERSDFTEEMLKNVTSGGPGFYSGENLEQKVSDIKSSILTFCDEEIILEKGYLGNRLNSESQDIILLGSTGQLLFLEPNPPKETKSDYWIHVEKNIG